jgi:hypothetical protein
LLGLACRRRGRSRRARSSPTACGAPLQHARQRRAFNSASAFASCGHAAGEPWTEMGYRHRHRFQCIPDGDRLTDKSLEGGDATAGVHWRVGRRGGVAGGSAGAAAGDAGDRISRTAFAGADPISPHGISQRAGRIRLCGGPQRGDRIPLGAR